VLTSFTQVTIDEIPDRPELRPIRRKLLEAALGYYKDFIEQEADDPDVQDELIASHWQVGNILREMGDKEASTAIFEQLRKTARTTAGPAGMPGLPGLGSPEVVVSSLLTQPAVARDLKLSDEQTRAIAADAQKRWEMMWSRHGPGDDGRRPQDFEALEKACFEVLRPEQARRLQQIVLQQRGGYVLADQDVADELGLKEDQRERIRRIQKDSYEKAIFAGFKDFLDKGKRSDDFGKSVSDRLFGVLTDEQKAKWKEMTGEPFRD